MKTNRDQRENFKKILSKNCIWHDLVMDIEELQEENGRLKFNEPSYRHDIDVLEAKCEKYKKALSKIETSDVFRTQLLNGNKSNLLGGYAKIAQEALREIKE